MQCNKYVVSIKIFLLLNTNITGAYLVLPFSLRGEGWAVRLVYPCHIVLNACTKPGNGAVMAMCVTTVNFVSTICQLNYSDSDIFFVFNFSMPKTLVPKRIILI